MTLRSAVAAAVMLAGASFSFAGLDRTDPSTRDERSRTIVTTGVADTGVAEVPDAPAEIDVLEPAPVDQTGELSAEDAQAIASADDAHVRRAVRVVAGFLQLDTGQVEGLVGLLQARRDAAQPIVQEIERREEILRLLVAAGDDPAAIGRQVLAIRELKSQLARVQFQFLMAFEDLLTPEQADRWRAARRAARLQPVLPAFAALALL